MAKEYRFEAGSHIRYQLPVSVSARRTLLQALVRTRQPHGIIATVLSRARDEHITLQVRAPSQTVTPEPWTAQRNTRLRDGNRTKPYAKHRESGIGFVARYI